MPWKKSIFSLTFPALGSTFASLLEGSTVYFLSSSLLRDVKRVPLRNSENECSGICCCFEKRCLLNLLDIWPRQFARGSTTDGLHVSTAGFPRPRSGRLRSEGRTKRASDSRHARQGGRGLDGLWRIILWNNLISNMYKQKTGWLLKK